MRQSFPMIQALLSGGDDGHDDDDDDDDVGGGGAAVTGQEEDQPIAYRHPTLPTAGAAEATTKEPLLGGEKKSVEKTVAR